MSLDSPGRDISRRRVTPRVDFCVQLLALSMCLRPSRVVMCVGTLSLFVAEHFMVWTCVLSPHSSVHGHGGCVCLLAAGNGAAANMRVHVSVRRCDLPPGWTRGPGASGSCGPQVLHASSLEELWTVFRSSCPVYLLCSHACSNPSEAGGAGGEGQRHPGSCQDPTRGRMEW